MRGCAQLPGAYRELFEVELQKDKKKALLVNGLAVLIAVVMAVIGAMLSPISGLFDMESGLGPYLLRSGVLILGCFGYLVLHELVHGIFMKHYSGVKVRYGFTGLYAYAGSEWYFDRTSYIIIALAPVVVWGVVLAVLQCFAGGAWFWVVYLLQIINISGAAGDLYVTVRFSKLPSDILIRDTGVHMTVYGREDITPAA